jgi:L-ascorbate metabolism protein UlaG (beta-lactamase superfamily)
MPKMNELTKRIRSNPFVRNFSNAKTPQSKREVKPSVPIKPVDQRLPPKVLEAVMSILASVQWDKWRFMLPAKPLLKLDVAVVSHSHADHWHPNFWTKDVVVMPDETIAPVQYGGLRNIIKVGGSPASLGPIRMVNLNATAIASVVGQFVPRPHANWWFVSTRNAGILFVGDVNIADLATMRHFIKLCPSFDFHVEAVLLPSYGGVRTHGAGEPAALAREIASVADELRRTHEVLIGALPHPIGAGWSDFNAVVA